MQVFYLVGHKIRTTIEGEDYLLSSSLMYTQRRVDHCVAQTPSARDRLMWLKLINRTLTPLSITNIPNKYQRSGVEPSLSCPLKSLCPFAVTITCSPTVNGPLG